MCGGEMASDSVPTVSRTYVPTSSTYIPTCFWIRCFLKDVDRASHDHVETLSGIPLPDDILFLFLFGFCRW